MKKQLWIRRKWFLDIDARPRMDLEGAKSILDGSNSHLNYIHAAVSLLDMLPPGSYPEFRADMESGEVWSSYGPSEFESVLVSMCAWIDARRYFAGEEMAHA